MRLTIETSYSLQRNKKDMRMHSTSKEIISITNPQSRNKIRVGVGPHRAVVLTHIIAKATSVTRNLLSTSHSCPTLPTIAAAHPSRPIPGRICNSSAKKVNAHRSPHHAAGTVLIALQTNRGMYHLRSTPKITATRG